MAKNDPRELTLGEYADLQASRVEGLSQGGVAYALLDILFFIKRNFDSGLTVSPGDLLDRTEHAIEQAECRYGMSILKVR